MTVRRLVLSTTALELLRQRVLPGSTLPPGFVLRPADGPRLNAADDAEALLLRSRAAVSGEAGWTPHPAVADDLRLLASPELAVVVRASSPGLAVTACIAFSRGRGVSLLRTGDSCVQLSSFPSDGLPGELSRVVPAADPAHGRAAQELPLDRLPQRDCATTGALRARVVSAAAGSVGSVLWVRESNGWIGLDPLPSRGGRPWVRLVPVGPADLPAWLAPLIAGAAG